MGDSRWGNGGGGGAVIKETDWGGGAAEGKGGEGKFGK